MIHSHIRKIAISLHEESYQCELPEHVRNANNTFEESAGVELDWMRSIRQREFKRKLRSARIDIPAGSKILDACCGQGTLGESLLDNETAVVFCDLSPIQLAALRNKFSERGISAKVVEADLHSLPFPDEEFDFIVGNSFLHHLSDTPRALGELLRVLKKGGRLIFFHEPSICANYWETFPWSLVKDTTYNSNFTDLWQFEAPRLEAVFKKNGFSNTSIRGSGLVSAVLLNWYFILLNKLRVTNKFALGSALRLSGLCHSVESPLRWWLRPDQFPSLFIVAERG